MYSSALKLPSAQYVGVLLDLGFLLVDRKKYTKAKDLLKLAMEIAQELEELGSGAGRSSGEENRRSSSNDGEDNSLLVRCLLNYSRCLELSAESTMEHSFSSFEDYQSEEALLGIWTDTVLVEAEEGGGKGSVLRHYADGNSLRANAGGHSRASMERTGEDQV